MSDDLENTVRIGSVLVPTFDAYPSTAVNYAKFNPFASTVTIVLHDGTTGEYPCSVETWMAYKMSGSRGAFFNENFRR